MLFCTLIICCFYNYICIIRHSFLFFLNRSFTLIAVLETTILFIKKDGNIPILYLEKRKKPYSAFSKVEKDPQCYNYNSKYYCHSHRRNNYCYYIFHFAQKFFHIYLFSFLLLGSLPFFHLNYNTFLNFLQFLCLFNQNKKSINKYSLFC